MSVLRIEGPGPNPKQAQFLRAKEPRIAYGGARGGGKSWAIRVKSTLLAAHYAGIRILVLRRTYPELYENFVMPLLKMLAAQVRDGICRYRETERAFSWVNGSRVVLGYCDNAGDLGRYQGVEYDVIFLDEATQWPEEWYQVLTACIRGVNGFPKRFYLTCNPGGVGHAWVKRLFIDRQYGPDENPADYRFIQARVFDNQALMDEDPGYLKNLEALPEKLRRGWLYGDWDLFEGQYFAEFRREKHVCRPFAVPESWRRYVTIDYGMDMLAALWIAVDEGGRAWVYRELYEGKDNGKGPDGRGHIISSAARRLLEMTPQGENMEAWLAPPDLWGRNRDSGRSTAETFLDYGIPLTQTSNSRVDGWRAVHEWLAEAGDGQGSVAPRLRIFENCPNLIRTLPALQYDDKHPEDAATEPHEITHAPDALRGFCIFRSRPADLPPEPQRTGVEVFYSQPRHDTDGMLGLGDEIELI